MPPFDFEDGPRQIEMQPVAHGRIFRGTQEEITATFLLKDIY